MSDTRSQLKQIATEQIRRHTLHSASFREMGKVLGIKSSSVHYHFENREALLQELIDDYEQAFFSRLDALCEGISSPVKQLQTLASLFSDSHSQQYQCLCLAFAAAGSETSAAQRAAVERFLLRLEGWICTVLTSAGVPQPATELQARFILSALEGALLLDRDQPEAQRLNAVIQYLPAFVNSHSTPQPETL